MWSNCTATQKQLKSDLASKYCVRKCLSKTCFTQRKLPNEVFFSCFSIFRVGNMLSADAELHAIVHAIVHILLLIIRYDKASIIRIVVQPLPPITQTLSIAGTRRAMLAWYSPHETKRGWNHLHHMPPKGRYTLSCTMAAMELWRLWRRLRTSRQMDRYAAQRPCGRWICMSL